MARRKKYTYTGRTHSVSGAYSTFFGVLSAVTYLICIQKSYLCAGADVVRASVAASFATIFLIVGCILAVISVISSNKFALFKISAVLTNLFALVLLSLILYAGAYV